MIPPDFHFLRPAWLLALLPAALLAIAAWRRLKAGRADWAGLIDPHLLARLALRDGRRGGRWPLFVLLLAWCLAIVAMAGPTWQKQPTPALERLDPVVVALSLGQSMNAADASPSRLAAARHKLEDILARMRGTQVGLVVYADVPFVASPLTEDGRVIARMLPELATDLMPVRDSRPDRAIAKAVELLEGAGAKVGRVLLLTDGIGADPAAALAAARDAAAAGFPVSVIGIGSAAPTPLLAADGSRVRGPDGSAQETRMDRARLSQLADAGGGAFTPLTADSRDLDSVFAQRVVNRAANPLQDSGLVADQWIDMGPWLLLLVVVLAPLAFRRGWIAVLLCAVVAGAEPASAAPGDGAGQGWQDLWSRRDQQGAAAFAAEDYATAAQRFEDPAWRAGALYRAGDFAGAAAAYAGVPGADYNRGNALARAGRLEEAVAAYDAAIAAEPGHNDAILNRALVQKLIDARKKEEEKKTRQPGGDGSGGGAQKPGDTPSPQDGGKDGSQERKPAADGKDGAGPGEQDPKKPPPEQKEAKDDKDKGPNAQKPPAPLPPKPAPDPGAPPPGDPRAQKQDLPPAPQPPAQGDGGPDTPKQPPPPPAAARAPGPPAEPGPEDGDRPAAVAAGAHAPLSEQDQNNEQILRLVPDDPGGLLRARIRSYYSGTQVKVGEDD